MNNNHNINKLKLYMEQKYMENNDNGLTYLSRDKCSITLSFCLSESCPLCHSVLAEHCPPTTGHWLPLPSGAVFPRASSPKGIESAPGKETNTRRGYSILFTLGCKTYVSLT